MAITYKQGDKVRQVAPVIEGEVVNVAIIDGDVQFCVEYQGADGETHQRFFAENEITAA